MSLRVFTAITMAALLSLLLTPSAALAYDIDFHYYTVYLLLRARGYPVYDANRLAGFSQYVDDNARTEPLWTFSSTRAKFHFAGSADERVTASDDDLARDAVVDSFRRLGAADPAASYVIGAALHLYADTFSHATFSAWRNRLLNCRAGSWRPCMGHADSDEDGHAPDHPYNAPAVALRAARALYEAIPPAPGGTVVPWDSLAADLAMAFNDFSAASIDVRVNGIRRVVSKHFGESPAYVKYVFGREKAAFEAAVLR